MMQVPLHSYDTGAHASMVSTLTSFRNHVIIRLGGSKSRQKRLAAWAPNMAGTKCWAPNMACDEPGTASDATDCPIWQVSRATGIHAAWSRWTRSTSTSTRSGYSASCGDYVFA